MFHSGEGYTLINGLSIISNTHNMKLKCLQYICIIGVWGSMVLCWRKTKNNGNTYFSTTTTASHNAEQLLLHSLVIHQSIHAQSVQAKWLLLVLRSMATGVGISVDDYMRFAVLYTKQGRPHHYPPALLGFHFLFLEADFHCRHLAFRECSQELKWLGLYFCK